MPTAIRYAAPVVIAAVGALFLLLAFAPTPAAEVQPAPIRPMVIHDVEPAPYTVDPVRVTADA